MKLSNIEKDKRRLLYWLPSNNNHIERRKKKEKLSLINAEKDNGRRKRWKDTCYGPIQFGSHHPQLYPWGFYVVCQPWDGLWERGGDWWVEMGWENLLKRIFFRGEFDCEKEWLIYIYIYIYRERERESSVEVTPGVCLDIAYCLKLKTL